MFGIIAFGDSITFGRGNAPSFSWAELFKKDFEKKDPENVFYNLGVPGDTSKTLLKRINTELESRVQSYRNDSRFAVMIMTGTNDTKHYGENHAIEIPKKVFESNFRKIIKTALKHTKEVFIIGLTPVDEKRTQPFQDKYFSNKIILEYNQILREVSLNNNVKFIDVFNFDHTDLADGLHLNKKGHKKLYKIIKEETQFEL